VNAKFVVKIHIVGGVKKKQCVARWRGEEKRTEGSTGIRQSISTNKLGEKQEKGCYTSISSLV
jgi:hypothetical protein